MKSIEIILQLLFGITGAEVTIVAATVCVYTYVYYPMILPVSLLDVLIFQGFRIIGWQADLALLCLVGFVAGCAVYSETNLPKTENYQHDIIN